jgi:hypothetical protein
MPTFRIETVEDPSTGRYAVEIYYPADAQRPYVTTAARYMTSAAAENDMLATIAAAANSPAQEANASAHAHDGGKPT